MVTLETNRATAKLLFIRDGKLAVQNFSHLRFHRPDGTMYRVERFEGWVELATGEEERAKDEEAIKAVVLQAIKGQDYGERQWAVKQLIARHGEDRAAQRVREYPQVGLRPGARRRIRPERRAAGEERGERAPGPSHPARRMNVRAREASSGTACSR